MNRDDETTIGKALRAAAALRKYSDKCCGEPLIEEAADLLDAVCGIALDERRERASEVNQLKNNIRDALEDRGEAKRLEKLLDDARRVRDAAIETEYVAMGRTEKAEAASAALRAEIERLRKALDSMDDVLCDESVRCWHEGRHDADVCSECRWGVDCWCCPVCCGCARESTEAEIERLTKERDDLREDLEAYERADRSLESEALAAADEALGKASAEIEQLKAEREDLYHMIKQPPTFVSTCSDGSLMIEWVTKERCMILAIETDDTAQWIYVDKVGGADSWVLDLPKEYRPAALRAEIEQLKKEFETFRSQAYNTITSTDALLESAVANIKRLQAALRFRWCSERGRGKGYCGGHNGERCPCLVNGRCIAFGEES